MTNHYMRLLTDTKLNDKQKQVWYSAVEKFLDAEHVAQPEEFLDTLTNNRQELEGDEDFPYVYVVNLNSDVDPKLAEQIVMLWSEIYPRDFEIESSAEYDDCECDDCDVEIDDAMYEEIQRRASKFLHNRWVEQQIEEGWRFAISTNLTEKMSPKIRDWDSLHESYRREIVLTKEQATEFFKKYSHLFV